jgi:type IV secretion system protein VirB10
MTQPVVERPAASPKVDPETLVLRGRPARVVRFRRGAIIALAAFGSAGVAGVTWIALKPATFRLVAAGEDRAELGAKAPPDALASAPKSYGEVPQLGPPLPGDLGRPILQHQRTLEADRQMEGRTDKAARAAQEAEAERQRLTAERRAARESAVMMQISSATGPRPAPAGRNANQEEVAQARAVEPELPAVRQNAATSGVRDRSEDLNPHSLLPAASPWTLSAGSVIAASLITGLNSDVPGLVTAQVTQNTYDSATGRILLIPQGSRLIGSYDSVVAFGQKRALVVWQRIVRPDGSSIRIDNVPATDTAGHAGLADRVDVHSWQLLRGVALSTLLGVGTELSIGGEGDLVRAVREATQRGAARAGDQLVAKNLEVKPTIRVRPGWPLRVVVHKDLVLAPWKA